MNQLDITQITQLTINTYLSLADKYHNQFKDELEDKDFVRYLLDQLSDSLPENAYICDAGCGPSAQAAKYLAELGNKVLGIDISPRCIEIAKNYCPDLEFQVADMRNSKIPDNTFDAVVSMYSIIHTPKDQAYQFFREFRDILKPGGKLMLTVKRGEKEGLETGNWFGEHEIYFSYFKEHEIRKLANDYGFEIDLVETRKPIRSEIEVDRIYLLATKK